MSNIENLLKKRKYRNSVENDSFVKGMLDNWMLDHPHYIIHYVSNSKSNIYNVLTDNAHHIIWDTSFWEIFSQFIYIIDEDILSLKFDQNAVIENSGYLIALFSKYLSKRFNYYESLSRQLGKNAEMFGYNILNNNLNKNTDEKQRYDFSIRLCKLFVFWHEVAHIEFQKYDSINALYKRQCNQVYSLLDSLPVEVFKDIPFFDEINDKIKKRKISPVLLEELSADLRAFQCLCSLEGIGENKKNFETLLFSYISLINFIIIKSTIDNHWDYHVNNKKNVEFSFIEILILRKTVFPSMICISLGASNLGNSLLFDLQIKFNNIELFFNNLYTIESEWYINSILNINYKTIYTKEIFCESFLMNTIKSHMQNITYNSSRKHLKYLFNKAHNTQHSKNSLDCIPLFFDFINNAVKNKDECITKNISDAYSRIARVYAENDNFISSQIMLSNALEIIEKISDKDIAIAFLYNNIGNVFLQIGDIDNAIKYYGISINIRIVCGEQQSINIATTYSNLGDAYLKSENYYQSLMYYLMAYQIKKKRYDENSTEIITLKEKLELFVKSQSNIPKFIIDTDMPFSLLKQNHENFPNDIEILKDYLFGIVREISIVSFDESSKLFIELLKLVNLNKHYSLLGVSDYAFANFKEQLKKELSI